MNGGVRCTHHQGLVPGAYAAPSTVFGMANAQNAGCALVKL